MTELPGWLQGYGRLDAARYERRRYGGLVRRLNRRLLERALGRALAQMPAGALVLDVPSGTGILHDVLVGRGLRVVASDVSRPMLALAQRRGLAQGCVLADVRRLPFRPDTFDAVVCSRFIMHLRPPIRGETLRALAALSRGPVITTVCHPYTLKTATRSLRRALGRRVKRSDRLSRGQLAGELAAVGLGLRALHRVVPGFSEVWVASIARV